MSSERIESIAPAVVEQDALPSNHHIDFVLRMRGELRRRHARRGREPDVEGAALKHLNGVLAGGARYAHS